jgi:peroxiredoxin Q/BCP
MKKLPRWRTLFMLTFLYQSLMGLVSAAEPLAVGATAPAIKVTNQENKTVDLGEVYKKGYTLVYFYPKAFTPGCTTEACTLRDAFADLTKLDVTVLGVSHDTPELQKQFKEQYKLPFDLVADPKGDVYKAFGVAGPGNRQSFLVKAGKVVWVDLKAVPDQQAIAVKKFIDADKAAPAKAEPAKPAVTATPPAASGSK